MDKARVRALLDQERRRLEQLSRAVARDHDNAVAGSRPEDPVDGADRRVAEGTSEALGERLGDRSGGSPKGPGPGRGRGPESRMGPSRDPFQVFDDPAAQDDGLVEEEGSDDEPGPQANLGIRTTPEA